MRDMGILNRWERVASAAYEPAYECNRVLYAGICTIVGFGLYFLCIWPGICAAPELAFGPCRTGGDWWPYLAGG